MAGLRKLFQALALIVLMTGSGYAQIAPLPDNNTPPTKEEREKKAADEAYRSGLKSIPAAESSADPWADLAPKHPHGGQEEATMKRRPDDNKH